MGILTRTIFREISSSALLGMVVFTFVLFLKEVSRLITLLVGTSAPPQTVGYLFLLILPFVLTFTVPVGVLVGVLIALSRMSGDNEIIAMRAAGVPSRRVVYAVMSFALVGFLVTASATLWLTPWSIRQRYKMLTKLAAAQLTADIQPRVFEERFPNRILYVGDVLPGTVAVWKNMFMADVSSPEARTKSNSEAGDGPLITTSEEVIAVPDVARNRIQLSLRNGATHEIGKDTSKYSSTNFPSGTQVLEAEKRGEVRPSTPFSEMDTGPLYRASKGSVEARIELHRRLALPPACLVLALIGIPLGATARKAGKSSAFVLTVIIAFLYWMSLISLTGLARQGTLPVGVAIWLPNFVLGAIGIWAFTRLERSGDFDLVGTTTRFFQEKWQNFRGSLAIADTPHVKGSTATRFLFLPQIVDTYVLSSFLFYFALLLASFVLMTQVYNFFELLSDVVKNHIPMSTVAKYLFFLTPHLIYDSTPMSVQVAVLVTFGVLSKNNEITALKACGVSLYRLAIPILMASTVISISLFAFDHYIIPDANLVQDRLRNQIKGRPEQTFLRPDRKWIAGNNSKIFYYKYFDPQGIMVGVNVYELDPVTFRLRKHISADRARWEPGLKAWAFQNGWAREITNGKLNYQAFNGTIATFPEINEPVSYFLKEDLQEKQMNFQQLADYISELRQSGLDTVRLQVQFYKKFAVPLFAVIMAMIAVPFAFSAGNRGAMAGIGVSFGIAIAYWSVSVLFEQIGNVNQLPASLAAWSPDAVFALGGLYFLARMRT
jgi:LPS export ABC transporter permease LptF/LPS export ABC transporter permease LptG